MSIRGVTLGDGQFINYETPIWTMFDPLPPLHKASLRPIVLNYVLNFFRTEFVGGVETGSELTRTDLGTYTYHRVIHVTGFFNISWTGSIKLLYKWRYYSIYKYSKYNRVQPNQFRTVGHCVLRCAPNIMKSTPGILDQFF